MTEYVPKAYSRHIGFLLVYLKRQPKVKSHHCMYFCKSQENSYWQELSQSPSEWLHEAPQVCQSGQTAISPPCAPPRLPIGTDSNYPSLGSSALSKAQMLASLPSSNLRWSLRCQSLCISEQSVLPFLPVSLL